MSEDILKKKVGKKILSIMAKGINPFKVPYSEAEEASYETYPVNYLTGKVYSGINQFCLQAGYYLTFSQAKQLGGRIKTGAKSTEIYYRSSVDKLVEDEETMKKIEDILSENPKRKSLFIGNTYYFLNQADEKWYKSFFFDKKFNVFNIEDIEGLKEIEGRFNKKELNPVSPNADKIVNDYCSREGFELRNSKEPSVDLNTKIIYVPSNERFENNSSYYQVLFNTLSASTAEKLNRKVSRVGTSSYSKEMLINEIAGILSIASTGLNDEECNANSGAYMKEWAKLIQGNNLEEKVWSCVSEAIRSYKYIFNI